jgi:hypothetical protein
MVNLRLLSIGINYIGTNYLLNGCINDSNNMNNFFKEYSINKNYNYSSILLNDYTTIKPTKSNILKYLIQELDILDSSDVFIFHFSGHGSNVKDLNRDELDKKDEVIVPIDYDFIIDDELYKTIYSHLKPNISYIFLFDSCHSGTMLDLQYTILENNKTIINNKNKNNFNIISISGCKDDQYSADAFIDNNYAGAMTTSFLKQFKSAKNWNELVKLMNKWLFFNQFTQKPLLSFSKYNLLFKYI